MIGSGFIYLIPQKASLGFSQGEVINELDTEFILLECSILRKNTKCILRVVKVAAEYEFQTVCPPIEEGHPEPEKCFGRLGCFESDKSICESETVYIHLNLKPVEFEQARYLIDRSFFSGDAEMNVTINVASPNGAWDSESDEFPKEEGMPLIGYEFILNSTGGHVTRQ